MKKKTILPLLLTSVVLCSCSGVEKYALDAYITKSNNTYSLTESDPNDFTICTFNDLHLANTTDIDRQLAYLNKVIDAYGQAKTKNNKKPDLIVLNGDSFMEANKRIVNKFFEWLNEKQIPFCYTYGNHDLQGEYSNSYIDSVLSKYSYHDKKGYSVLRNPVNDEVYGDANYVYNIMKNEEEVAWQIYMFDSNTYYNFSYDHIHQDQVDWYRKQVKLATDNNGGTPVPSLMFFHIPTEDFADAWKQRGEKQNGGTGEYKDEMWYMGESVSCSPLKTSLFDTVVQLGSTKGIICAHDHVNVTRFEYKKTASQSEPVSLMFGMKSGDGIYHDTGIIGASFYTLHSNGKFDMTNIRVSYDDKVEPHIITPAELNAYNGK